MLRRLRSDEGGVAAIEFALVAPVAVLLYCGFAELTMAMIADQHVAHAASVMGDLVAQTPQITTSQITDIYTVGGAIMSPFSATPLQIRITSVVANSNAVPRVSWSQASGMSPLVVGAAVSGFPANLLAAGDSVIEADVQYSYSSPLQMTLPNAITFSNSFYLKPRKSTSVTLVVG